MSLLNKKKILITGGAGFIGSWLAKELIDLGARVIVLDLKDSHPILNDLQKKPILIRGDVRSYNLVKTILRERHPDFIFHFAAQTIVGIANRNPLPTLKTNIAGTWHILEAARCYPAKGIIIASSDKAYGDQPVIPYKENTPLVGMHPYDVSKSSADLIAQMYFKTYQLPLCIIRSANVFGGGDIHFSRVIPETIRAAFYNKSPIIRSDGRFERDYLYIKDEINGCLMLAGALFKKREVLGQAFNFGTNHPYFVEEVVKIILDLMQKNNLKPLILNEAKNEIRNQSLDFSKAKKLLGWQPQYSLKDGLKETIQWYTQYFKGKKC